jgi:hypothetical protein
MKKRARWSERRVSSFEGWSFMSAIYENAIDSLRIGFLARALHSNPAYPPITHLAFYAGRPPAMTAMQIARKVFDEAGN